MKRYLALIIAGMLTMLATVAIVVTILYSSASPTTADQIEPVVESVIELPAPPQPAAEPVYDLQLEATIQAREETLQQQVSERRLTLTDLDRTSQAQINQLTGQLAETQARLAQSEAALPDLQANLAALQQAISQDDTTYKAELTKLAETEQQLRLEVEQSYNRLDSAYNQLAQQQAAAAAAAANSYNSGSGGGGGGESHDDHDDHNNRENEHENEREDGHENEHEDDD